LNNIALNLFLSGLLFGSGPCIASCGPLLVSFIAGTGRGPLKGLYSYALFSLSRIIAYGMLSLLIFFSGTLGAKSFQANQAKFTLILGGGYCVLVGLLMLFGSNQEPRFYTALKSRLLERGNKSALVMGFIIGMLPCGPLFAVFSYTGLISKSWPESLVFALIFGLGTFLSPLIILSIAAGGVSRILPKKPIFQRILSGLCGMVISILGIQLMKGAF